MRSEAPIISKALRLASVVVIVAVVALAASVGYSAFQEYKVLGGAIQQQSGQQSGNGTQMTLNGNQLSLSGITVPNNMTYPLGLQLKGVIYLAGVQVSSFASPMQTIMPGQIGHLNVTAKVNYTAILSNSTALSSMFLQPANLATSFSIFAAIDPVANLNITNTSNSTIGPILGQFTVAPQTPYLSSNATEYVLPVQVSWNNSSPLQMQAGLGAEMTRMPGQPYGDYGSASEQVNITQGMNEDTLDFRIPISQFNPQTIHGTYDFNITFSAYGGTVTFQESATY
jgi:hypothetical protein